MMIEIKQCHQYWGLYIDGICVTYYTSKIDCERDYNYLINSKTIKS